MRAAGVEPQVREVLGSLIAVTGRVSGCASCRRFCCVARHKWQSLHRAEAERAGFEQKAEGRLYCLEGKYIVHHPLTAFGTGGWKTARGTGFNPRGDDLSPSSVTWFRVPARVASGATRTSRVPGSTSGAGPACLWRGERRTSLNYFLGARNRCLRYPSSFVPGLLVYYVCLSFYCGVYRAIAVVFVSIVWKVSSLLFFFRRL